MFSRVIKSLLAIGAGQLLTVANNLLLVPLFLSYWPTGVYGEWAALSALAAYFGITDLGMNSAAGNALTAAYAQGEMKRYARLQGSAMAFYVAVAIIGSLIFALSMLLLPLPKWIGIRSIPSATAAIVAWFIVTRILWQMPSAQLGAVYRSMGKFAITQWMGNAQSLGLLLITIAVLLSRCGVLTLAVWSSLPLVITSAGMWLLLRRTYPALTPKMSEARLVSVGELLRPSLFFGLIMIATAVVLNGPVLLVSRTMGGAAVALLVTSRTLANLPRQVGTAAQVALWPELTRMDAVGSEDALRLAHRLLPSVSLALCLGIGGALWFEGGEMMTLWTRAKLVENVLLLRLFIVAVTLQAPWFASSLFLMAGNYHRRLAWSYFWSAVVTILAVASLISHFELLAVPMAVIIGEAVACYHFVIKDSCATVKEPYVRFALRLWSGLLLSVSATGAAGLLAHRFSIGPVLPRVIEVSVVTTIIAATATWLACVSAKDRAVVVSLIRTRLDRVPSRDSVIAG